MRRKPTANELANELARTANEPMRRKPTANELALLEAIAADEAAAAAEEEVHEATGRAEAAKAKAKAARLSWLQQQSMYPPLRPAYFMSAAAAPPAMNPYRPHAGMTSEGLYATPALEWGWRGMDEHAGVALPAVSSTQSGTAPVLLAGAFTPGAFTHSTPAMLPIAHRCSYLPGQVLAPTTAPYASLSLPPAVTIEHLAGCEALASFSPKPPQDSILNRQVAIGSTPARNGADRREWTELEDYNIQRAVQEHGCCWRKIAAQLPGRSDDAVRNRWFRIQRAASLRDAHHGAPRDTRDTPAGLREKVGGQTMAPTMAPPTMAPPTMAPPDDHPPLTSLPQIAISPRQAGDVGGSVLVEVADDGVAAPASAAKAPAEAGGMAMAPGIATGATMGAHHGATMGAHHGATMGAHHGATMGATPCASLPSASTRRGHVAESVGSRAAEPRVSWSKAEDDTILSSVAELGNRWSKLADRLPGRTEHAIRNRFHRLQNIYEDRRRRQQPALAPGRPLNIVPGMMGSWPYGDSPSSTDDFTSEDFDSLLGGGGAFAASTGSQYNH